MLSILNICLCRQSSSALEDHHRCPKEDFIIHILSFLVEILIDVSLLERKRKINKTNKNNNISFRMSEKKKKKKEKSQLFAFSLRGYRTRVRLHRLLLPVMSRSTQVVSFLSSSFYQNMCACEIIYDWCMHTHQIFCFKYSNQEEKKSSFYVYRWEIIGFVKGITQTVFKEGREREEKTPLVLQHNVVLTEEWENLSGYLKVFYRRIIDRKTNFSWY